MGPLLWLAGAALPPPVLDLPIACLPGRSCWVQKLVDVDPGRGLADFRCGRMTTDQHDGIDFRLASHAALRAGVAVRAAAPGRVVRVRDGEPDVTIARRGSTGGRDAGNAVVIDHGGGWETQYSHLARGSLTVRVGDAVLRGAPIGRVGLSGMTEYPHLHFAVRQATVPRDPFNGLPIGAACGQRGAGLWSGAARQALGTPGPALVRAALSSAPYGFAALGDGDPAPPTGTTPIVLVLEAIAAEAGDVQSFRLTGPDGKVLLARDIAVDGGGLSWIGYAGVRPPPGGWPAGRYRGEASLTRGPKVIGQATVELALP